MTAAPTRHRYNMGKIAALLWMGALTNCGLVWLAVDDGQAWLVLLIGAGQAFLTWMAVRSLFAHARVEDGQLVVVGIYRTRRIDLGNIVEIADAGTNAPRVLLRDGTAVALTCMYSGESEKGRRGLAQTVVALLDDIQRARQTRSV